MKKIYLFCSAGMSTSLLASNMQKLAEDHNLNVEVKAFSIARIDEVYDKEHPNCILLGPQVGFAYEDIKEKYKKLNIPVGLIDSNDYGTLNGGNVLRLASNLLKKGA
ncbi:PTS sugar transporter subunit IIB [Clostridium guangxiense]|uniref:PTS sugar transporter subunit IIB n=1 Tax=Clostridium guangxiense TaxID=1662055 RepID=UPI001E3930A9|nr:PTS sugar transporter subunit IIB [Clostridium guangxiense]MCD2346948.1 PTS sugar transporter subunit IIB [Clostridium guangxiense]